MPLHALFTPLITLVVMRLDEYLVDLIMYFTSAVGLISDSCLFNFKDNVSGTEHPFQLEIIRIFNTWCRVWGARLSSLEGRVLDFTFECEFALRVGYIGLPWGSVVKVYLVDVVYQFTLMVGCEHLP